MSQQDLWPIGELTLADLKNDAPLPKEGAVVKLRTTHHAIARLLAEGRKHVEVAAITGYTQNRISVLLADPTFKELVEFYREQVSGKYLDVHERLATLGVTATEILQERLETDADDVPYGVLIKVAEMAFDRSVAPKKDQGTAGGGNAPSISINFVKNEPQSITIDGEILEND